MRAHDDDMTEGTRFPGRQDGTRSTYPTMIGGILLLLFFIPCSYFEPACRPMKNKRTSRYLLLAARKKKKEKKKRKYDGHVFSCLASLEYSVLSKVHISNASYGRQVSGRRSGILRVLKQTPGWGGGKEDKKQCGQCPPSDEGKAETCEQAKGPDMSAAAVAVTVAAAAAAVICTCFVDAPCIWTYGDVPCHICVLRNLYARNASVPYLVTA